MILLDIAMPQVSGFELCRRLKARPNCRNAMIVAYTGIGGEKIRAKIDASGFDGLLVKPVEGRLCGTTIENAQGDATD